MGKWQYSQRFQQADIIIGKMGKPLSWFDELNADDKTYIIAYWTTKDKMNGWDEQKAKEALEKAQHGT